MRDNKPGYVPMCPSVDEDTDFQCELEDGHDGHHEATLVWGDEEET